MGIASVTPCAIVFSGSHHLKIGTATKSATPIVITKSQVSSIIHVLSPYAKPSRHQTLIPSLDLEAIGVCLQTIPRKSPRISSQVLRATPRPIYAASLTRGRQPSIPAKSFKHWSRAVVWPDFQLIPTEGFAL